MDREKLIEAMARAWWDADRDCEGLPFETFRHEAIKCAQAALEAHDALMEQAGYVSVPAEPTNAMLEAGDMGLAVNGVDDTTTEDARACYRAMIAAATGEE